VITDKSDIKRYCLNYRKDKSEWGLKTKFI
jgi:hypothetical protein